MERDQPQAPADEHLIVVPDAMLLAAFERQGLLPLPSAKSDGAQAVTAFAKVAERASATAARILGTHGTVSEYADLIASGISGELRPGQWRNCRTGAAVKGRESLKLPGMQIAQSPSNRLTPEQRTAAKTRDCQDAAAKDAGSMDNQPYAHLPIETRVMLFAIQRVGRDCPGLAAQYSAETDLPRLLALATGLVNTHPGVRVLDLAVTLASSEMRHWDDAHRRT